MTQDSAPTRQRLLAAATEEFATHGIAGARVDRIAARANANKERIYGYFGSKQKLFDQVVGQALDELAAAVPLAPGDDPVAYVGRVHDFHRANPTLVRLLLWEALHYGADPLPNEADRAARYARKVGSLAETFGTDVAPHVAASFLLMVGLAVWPHAVPQIARMIMGVAPPPPSDLREHVMAFARGALSDSLPDPATA